MGGSASDDRQDQRISEIMETADQIDAPLPKPKQGRPTPTHIREQVIALTMTTDMSTREIGRQVGISPRTVSAIQRELMEEDDETFARIRARQKRKWVSDAWEAVEHLTMAAVQGAAKLARDDADLSARDVRDLTVAAGIMIDKTALVMGETGPGSGPGQTREVAEAVISAWERGREAGIEEATPRRADVIDAET